MFFFFFLFCVELAEIFFVDTTPFVDMYFSDPEGHTYDWSGIGSRKAYISSLLKVHLLTVRSFKTFSSQVLQNKILQNIVHSLFTVLYVFHGCYIIKLLRSMRFSLCRRYIDSCFAFVILLCNFLFFIFVCYTFRSNFEQIIEMKIKFISH